MDKRRVVVVVESMEMSFKHFINELGTHLLRKFCTRVSIDPKATRQNANLHNLLQLTFEAILVSIQTS